MGIGAIVDFIYRGTFYRGLVHDIIGEWARIVVVGCDVHFTIPVDYLKVHRESVAFIDLCRD